MPYVRAMWICRGIEMSTLSTADKKYLYNALRFVRFPEEGGYRKFYAELNIEIDDTKYAIYGANHADKLSAVIELENNQVVGQLILEFASLFRNEELGWGAYSSVKFSFGLEKIGQKLLTKPEMTPITICNNQINIEIRPEIYEHIKQYLDEENYFHAVEEAYKVVRQKLKTLTKKERATEVFGENALNKTFHSQLFGIVAEEKTPESDFCRGVGYLNLAVQFLRNEKAHSLAKDLDKNLAIHYLSLASLSYDLISRGKNE